MALTTIKHNLSDVLTEYFDKVTFPKNGIFVVGCSTSEISGDWKGTNSRLDVGKAVVETLEEFLLPRGIHMAIQGCEHINRALLVERDVAEQHRLEVVSVVPAIHAGGGTQVAAYQRMTDPVEVEHITAFGGIDIGGTEIGMHVKFVQIPVRMAHRKVGAANVVCLSSRPKLIGGERARYDFTEENTKDYLLEGSQNNG
ncbi:TIGR01440 family protein [Lentilactobacillus hilgardii]|jgi:uncharacterized protein (TIGR01440 family)|uniref:UPF0340 protein GQR93_13630 n=1 Tax=Lentilactobacillus hilgardii TaxID=1588 RepID=A0A6P1EGN4_LENHI|nr:TIGR01440 family protein [Lentilactobacillus hilgardii]EEI72636.1 TIGR01440 family protein [Lentilactobacillus hilgardii ATCC 27305]MCT3391977.1 TIGR01440 family protein [Lentilactobacillus hilgardii]QHB53154.1 TIGR01440 family protein [Lentilactobacillus hilgardii]RRG11324.1 MAG: TIGR01440 family protein [Lactobacillus sp.]